MRIAVTGATGFVGRAVVPELVAAGHSVVAVGRRTEAESDRLVWARCEDLNDAVALRSAFRSVDAVVHLAARAHVMGEHGTDAEHLFQRVNVEGTRAVRDAAIAEGVRRFIFVSSVKVQGDGRGTPYTEHDALAPTDAYGRSKRDAEQLVATLPAEIAWTILCPPLMYGPEVRGNFRRLIALAALAQRVPLPLGTIANRRSLLFVGNMASAIRTAVEREDVRCGRYLLSDGVDVSTSRLLAETAHALGGSARLVPCPTFVLRLALAAVGKSEEAARIFGSLTVDSSAFTRDFGWRTPRTLEQGLAVTAAWWKSRQLP